MCTIPIKVVLGLVLGIALAGCSATTTTSQQDPGGTQQGSEISPEEPSDGSRFDGTDLAEFGETLEWENGLAITVVEPEPYQPLDPSAVDEEQAHVLFTITIENESGASFKPVAIFVGAASGSVEAQRIKDYQDPQLADPWTSVPHGKTLKFHAAFTVTDPFDITVDVSPDSSQYIRGSWVSQRC